MELKLAPPFHPVIVEKAFNRTIMELKRKATFASFSSADVF